MNDNYKLADKLETGLSLLSPIIGQFNGKKVFLASKKLSKQPLPDGRMNLDGIMQKEQNTEPAPNRKLQVKVTGGKNSVSFNPIDESGQQ